MLECLDMAWSFGWQKDLHHTKGEADYLNIYLLPEHLNL